MHDESFGCIGPKRLVGSPEESLDMSHRTVSVSFIFMLSRKNALSRPFFVSADAPHRYPRAPAANKEGPLFVHCGSARGITESVDKTDRTGCDRSAGG